MKKKEGRTSVMEDGLIPARGVTWCYSVCQGSVSGHMIGYE